MQSNLYWYPGAVFAEDVIWGGYYPIVIWDQDLYEKHQEDANKALKELREELYG